MKSLNVFVFLLIFAFAEFAFGQGQINLLNGGIIKIDSVTGKDLKKVYYLPAGDKSISSIRSKKIFSISFADGHEDIYYTYDSLINGDMTVPHMRSYILGRQNAAEYYHAPSASIGGIIFGSASSILGLVYGPVPIALYSVIASRHYPNVAHQEFADKNMLNDDYYLYGYQIKAKRKKLFNAFVFGVVSFGICYGITAKNTSVVEKDIDNLIKKFFK